MHGLLLLPDAALFMKFYYLLAFKLAIRLSLVSKRATDVTKQEIEELPSPKKPTPQCDLRAPLMAILENPRYNRLFRKYLVDHFAEESLDFWNQVQEYKVCKCKYNNTNAGMILVD
jgi:hypothetical protein